MKLSVIAAIVGGIIFTLAIISNSGVVSAGGPPSGLDVNVTNTPNVSVVNTPTVNIGTGSVGITGTPNINVANTPTVSLVSGTNVGITGTPNVSVANTITNPVLVRDVDNPAIQPFQISLPTISDTIGSDAVSFNVPSDKRLVIEFISAACGLPSGQKMEFFIKTVAANHTAEYVLIPNLVGTFFSGTTDIIVASQQVRLYADPGSTVELAEKRNSNSGTAFVDFSVSGYLMNTS